MIVVDSEIRALNLITPKSQVRIKNSTCDLTIGEIYPMDLDPKHPKEYNRYRESIWLKPNHMANVSTIQRVELPDNVTGLATLVTSLTKEGILCLNVGVIDPGYNGRLSATLVNFSNKPRKIYVGQRLFRVLFFKHKHISEFQPLFVSNADHEVDVRNRAIDEFSSTFLDVEGLKSEVEERASQIFWANFTKRYWPYIAGVISITALLVSILNYLARSSQ